MTVGSRIVFMRFATARSPKLQLWIDHFDRVVGHGPRVVNSVVSGLEECIVVWHLVSANNRMLARSANLYERFEDAQRDARAISGSTASREFVLTSHNRRGEYGWYSTLDGEVEMICARWYGTDRDRRNAIELAELSLIGSQLAAGARPIDPEINRGQREHAGL
ncbi:MAG: hypothetical protein H7279_09665 [Microbacteriaceae bacterium]|nr:hypothetical protein [Microbacteriaceae bacterium]